MGLFSVAYYLLCYGLSLAGLAFSFALRPRGQAKGGPRSPLAGFRGILISACVGTIGMTVNKFGTAQAGKPLLPVLMDFLSLLAIPGCVAFLPRFIEPFHPHPRGPRAMKAFAALGAACLPLSIVSSLTTLSGTPGFLLLIAAIVLPACLAASICYCAWGAYKALRHPEETKAAVGEAWLASFRAILVSSLVIAPLTILNDFFFIPLALGLKGVPDALPLLTAAWSLAFIVPSARRIDAPECENGEYDWPEAGLTPRETEVARLLVSGYSYRMIAERLGISAVTVKSHVLSAYDKTGAGNKIELLTFASRASRD